MYELTRLFLLIKTLNKHQKRLCLDTGTVTKKRSRVHFTPREGRNPSWNNRWELASLPGPWKNRDVSCPGVLDFQDCHNQIPQTGWLQQKNYIISQFWRPEVQNQGVSRVGSFWRLWGRISPTPLPELPEVSWSADASLWSLIHLHMAFSLCVFVCAPSHLLKDTVILD